MEQYINYWVDLYNNTPAGAFWLGVTISTVILACGIYFAVLAWRGKGVFSAGPARTLITLSAALCCAIGLQFFIAEPLIQSKAAQIEKPTINVGEHNILKVSPIERECEECTDTMIVSYTVNINGITREYSFPVIRSLYVFHPETPKRPEWLYEWKTPEPNWWNI